MRVFYYKDEEGNYKPVNAMSRDVAQRFLSFFYEDIVFFDLAFMEVSRAYGLSRKLFQYLALVHAVHKLRCPSGMCANHIREYYPKESNGSIYRTVNELLDGHFIKVNKIKGSGGQRFFVLDTRGYAALRMYSSQREIILEKWDNRYRNKVLNSFDIPH